MNGNAACGDSLWRMGQHFSNASCLGKMRVFFNELYFPFERIYGAATWDILLTVDGDDLGLLDRFS